MHVMHSFCFIVFLFSIILAAEFLLGAAAAERRRLPAAIRSCHASGVVPSGWSIKE